jgi:hypothetical protein
LALSAVVLAGCQATEPGTTLSLGKVGYDKAFVAAEKVMSQYFSVAAADDAAGTVACRPKPAPAKAEGLLRAPPARHVATMRLRRSGEEVVAHVTVAVERQEAAAHRQLRMIGADREPVPLRTPAELDAATTAEQNDEWAARGHDAALERAILRDLYEALWPEESP